MHLTALFAKKNNRQLKKKEDCNAGGGQDLQFCDGS